MPRDSKQPVLTSRVHKKVAAKRKRLPHASKTSQQAQSSLCDVCISCLQGRSENDPSQLQADIHGDHYTLQHHASPASLMESAERGCAICAPLWDKFAARQKRAMAHVREFRPNKGHGFTSMRVRPELDSAKFRCWTDGIQRIAVHTKDPNSVDDLCHVFDELEIETRDCTIFLVPSSGQSAQLARSLLLRFCF